MRLIAVFCALLLFAQLSAQNPGIEIDLPAGKKPYTSLEVNNDPGNFQFAIVTDRTGGHRPGVFKEGVDKLNLLQPEFVMSVGDLIEGYTTDQEELLRQWEEFDGMVNDLEMPFFYVPGNHDITNPVMAELWEDRLGPSYYHFVYQDVLFLCLNSEDQARGAGRGTISDAQFEYIKKTLAEVQDVKWTLVFLHQPLWVQKAETLRWPEVEQLLSDRPHTVFAGHRHNYEKFERNNNKYFMLATTGGGSSLRGPQFGEFDHVVWVTMTDQGPIIANLLLEGIWDENVATEASKKFIKEVIKSQVIQVSPLFKDGYDFSDMEAELQIRNDQDMPLEVRFSEGFSWDLVGAIEQEVLTVAPNSVETVPFKITARNEVELGKDLRPMRLKVDLSYVTGEEQRVTIPTTLLIKPQQKRYILKEKTAQVDGHLDEWKELPYTFLPEDHKGLQLDYEMAEDGEYLYLAAKVQDDEINTDTSRSVWGQDNIGWVVSGLPLRKSYMARGNNWYQQEAGIRVTPSNEQFPSKSYLSEGTPEGAQFVCVETEGGYILEAAVPIAWIKEQQGDDWKSVRINFLLDDMDQDFEQGTRFFVYPDWRRDENILGSGTFFRQR